jgi:uncharacterized protein (DUF488 family)
MASSSRQSPAETSTKCIWTVGHSTRSEQEFLNLLKVNGIDLLIDVRAFPSSRRHPQFNRDHLSEFLLQHGISYRHQPSLGGRRAPRPDSKNTAWKNPSFRAYADYMETEEFKEGINELLEVSQGMSTAIMCAEALWWRCHRSLIADYLKSLGWSVFHILNETKTESHPYTSAARIVEGRLSYRGLFDSE